jgi:hypothetical protein
MIIHGDTLISEDLLAERFACDIRMCKGACCVEGDKGAPIDPKEIPKIEKNLNLILEELDDVHQSFIHKHGFYEVDDDGELVTTCLDNGQCCFVQESSNGTLSCAMESAYYKNKTDFIKPISCHLYPVRIKEFETYTVLNYNQWYLCADACVKGKVQDIKVYSFVEKALRRRFGDEWYEALCEIDKAREDLSA